MSIPVPLGVRIYDNSSSLDVWVTRWVEDVQFRSVVPGGFASASFRLHVPQHLQPVAAGWSTRAERSPLVRLFNRVQIVDLRTSEIAWEGRIDSAARVTDDGFSWDVGCAGAMVSATDITKPVFYIDSSATYWLSPTSRPSIQSRISWDQGENPTTLNISFASGASIVANDDIGAYYHFLCFTTGQYLGRFTITYRSNAPQVTGGTNLLSRANVYTPSTDTWQNGVDSTNLGAADVTKSNAVGASSSFTSTSAQVISLSVASTSTNLTIPSSGSGGVYWGSPIVTAMRVDRNGTMLTSASSYANDYVTVSQVVEDVLGRFLVGAWTTSSGAPLNNPANGQVRAADAYIDTSSTTQITNLVFADGATAADVLNQLMTIQTNAYWAIWESTQTATNDTNRQRYRFEWATWPSSPGYMVTSADGLDEQPDGSGIYNFVNYNYTNTWSTNIWMTPMFLQEWWDFQDPRTAPLLYRRVTRAATVQKDGITTNSGTQASQWLAANGKETNAGSIVVKRPVQFYDAGLNSGSGAGRMVDPWMIRPGKLIRIIDIPPQADINNFNHGALAPPATHTGSVFKVVATNYDSSDNSCHLELDQVTTWSLPGQIVPAAATNVQTIPG